MSKPVSDFIFTMDGKTYSASGTVSPLIAEWRTRGGRFWYKVYRNADSSYRYACDNGGGCLGILANDSEAIAEIQRRCDDSAAFDKINFKRTL